MQQQEQDIDIVLDKWEECRKTIDAMEKKIRRYRQNVEKFLETKNTDLYENSRFRVKRSVQQRSLLTKKNVPKEIWDTYSLPQRVEFLVLTDKSLKKNNSLKKKVG